MVADPYGVKIPRPPKGHPSHPDFGRDEIQVTERREFLLRVAPVLYVAARSKTVSVMSHDAAAYATAFSEAQLMYADSVRLLTALEQK